MLLEDQNNKEEGGRDTTMKVTAIPQTGKGTEDIKDIKNSTLPEPSQDQNEQQEGRTQNQHKNLFYMTRTGQNLTKKKKSRFKEMRPTLNWIKRQISNKGAYTGSGEPYPKSNKCLHQEIHKEEPSAKLKDGEENDVSNDKHQEGGDQIDATNTEGRRDETTLEQNKHHEGGDPSTSLQTDGDKDTNSKGIITRIGDVITDPIANYLLGKS